jgi:hypothetical protein
MILFSSKTLHGYQEILLLIVNPTKLIKFDKDYAKLFASNPKKRTIKSISRISTLLPDQFLQAIDSWENCKTSRIQFCNLRFAPSPS